MPVGPQRDDLLVKVRADFSGGADNEALTRGLDEWSQGGGALIPMLQDVGRQCGDANESVHRVDGCHRLFDPSPLDVVEASRSFIGYGIKLLVGDCTGQLDRNQSGLEVDLYRRTVVDGP